MTEASILLRDVVLLDGRRTNVRIEAGRIAAIGAESDAGIEVVDAACGLLIPGLHDHHIHLFATAAARATVALHDARSWEDIVARLDASARAASPGSWIRAAGYDERIAGLAPRPLLDAAFPTTPVRIQDRTGALWILNGAALAALGAEDLPAGLERDEAGAFTGLLWREDRWLRARLAAVPPDLTALSWELASFGVTGVTDASVSTDDASALAFARARRSGALVQKLTLLSGGALAPDPDGLYTVGPRKIVLDERALPDVGEVAALVAESRSWGRAVAFHCVTAAELTIALAALDDVGAQPGDRIEHAGVTPAALIADMQRLGVTVVTQPGFIDAKGDRYLSETSADEVGDLYRCAAFAKAGVGIAGSSDAPFGPIDPWRAMRTAITRASASGAVVGADERVSIEAALNLYLAPAVLPGAARRVEIGAPADLCLLAGDVEAAVAGQAPVAATWIDGVCVYTRP
ncbi:MAG: amidohydrolase family protein [Caulobacterales bacterium]